MTNHVEDPKPAEVTCLAELLCPLIVIGDRGPLLFRSAGSLEVHLDPSHVARGRYGPVFDAEGRLLSLELPDVEAARPRSRRTRGSAFVELVVSDREPAHQYLLRTELERALGLPAHCGADLFDLVVAATGRFGLI